MVGRHISQRDVILVLITFFAVLYFWRRPTPLSSYCRLPPRLADGTHPNQILSQQGEGDSAKATRPVIGKVTIMVGDEELETRTRLLRAHSFHAETHGYEMFVLQEELIQRKLWSKPAYMLSIVLRELERPRAERLKWLCWVNNDILMLNSQIPLEIFLPPEPDFRHVNLLVTNDHNGLNSGVFLIRICEWAVQFLSDNISMPTYRPDLPLRYEDQSAMEALTHDELYANSTLYVPQRWFNAYRGPRDTKEQLRKGSKIPDNAIRQGDLHLHLTGTRASQKQQFSYWIRTMEDRLWEASLEKTTYPAEIAQFWNTLREEGKAVH